MDKLNPVDEITHTDGVLRISQRGAAEMLLRIDMMIMSSPGYRLRTDATGARIMRGIHPGDVVRWNNALVEYHGDGLATVIHRRWDSQRCELVETRREDKTLTARQCVELLMRAALEAHANAIHAPDGAHHAFTGTAYNPAPR